MTPDALINAWSIAIGVIMLVVGWIVAHRYEMRRDRLAKRRELRVQYLIEAYRSLEACSNRPLTDAIEATVERAIADVQLFGSVRQVELARKFGLEFAQFGTSPTDTLLAELRDDLRAELELDPVPPVLFLRIKPRNEAKPSEDVPA